METDDDGAQHFQDTPVRMGTVARQKEEKAEKGASGDIKAYLEGRS
jgi:hypothetical protein